MRATACPNPVTRSQPWLLWALITLASIPTPAAEVRAVQVERDDQRFRIDMHIALDARPARVFQALQDYAAMPRYNPDLRSVRIEPSSDPGRVRLFTTIHTCVLFFCKTLHQQQVMTARADRSGGTLRADLIPQGSAFSGQGLWIVKPCRNGRARSCIDLELDLVPQFWVPPVIGPWLVRRTMSDEAQRSTLGLEQLARAGVGP